MIFSLDGFVANARQAAAAENPLNAVEQLMAKTFTNPQAIAAAVPAMDENEVHLFEDETVSIWHERFLHTEELPPHDHQMPAVIGVYHGVERNRLYRQVGGALAPNGTLVLSAGDTHVLGPNDVHTVQALDDAPSFGLHVYLGALSRVERSLFEWDSGVALPMTDAAFMAMKRSASGAESDS